MSLRVNFSQKEADSKAREIVPSGSYLCNIVEIEERQVKPGGKNSGKPYWGIRFVVQEGKYEGFSIFGNIMLFSTEKDGTLSSLAQFLKSCGYNITEGEFELPDTQKLQGKSLMVIGEKKLAGYDRKAQRDLPERFRINGYKRSVQPTSGRSGTEDSILP